MNKNLQFKLRGVPANRRLRIEDKKINSSKLYPSNSSKFEKAIEDQERNKIENIEDFHNSSKKSEIINRNGTYVEFLDSLKEKFTLEFSKYENLKYFNFDIVNYNIFNIITENAHEIAKLHDTTIETVAELLSKMLRGDNQELEGLPQTDKSRIIALVKILFPVLFTAINKSASGCVSFVFTPGTNNVLIQLENKYDAVEKLMKAFSISYKNKNFSIEQENMTYRKLMLEAIQKDKSNDIKKIKQLNINGDLFFSARKAELKFLDKVIKILNKAGIFLQFTRDESHHSVDEKSIMAKFESVLKEINDRHSKISILVVSATNFEQYKFQKTYVRLGIGFTGFPTNEYYYREYKNSNMNLINHQSIVEYGNDNGIFELDLVIPNMYKNEDSWQKSSTLKDKFKSHYLYQKFCENKLFDLISHFYESNIKNSKGMLLRFLKDNEGMEELIENINKKIDLNVKFIRYTGKCDSTIIEILDQEDYKNDDFFYIIYVTARARMSDTIPSDIKIGIDFTQEASTIAALIQGTLGRFGGYGKEDSLVLLSNKSIKILDDFLHSEGIKWSKKKTNNHIRIGLNTRNNLKLTITKSDEICKRIINKAEVILNENVRLGNLKISQSVKLGPNIKLGANPTDKMNISFFDDILTIDDEKYFLDKYYPGEIISKEDLSLTKKGKPIIQSRTQKNADEDKSKTGGTHSKTILLRTEIIGNRIIVHSINIPKFTNITRGEIKEGCVGDKLNIKGVA